MKKVELIAEVGILKRLPRATTVFDYTVNNEMVVSIGDLVSVPFRNKVELGIVLKVKKNTTTPRLKPITKIIAKEWFASEQIALHQRLAKYYGVALGSSLMQSLVFKPTKKFLDLPLSTFKKNAIKKTSAVNVVTWSDQKTHQELIIKLIAKVLARQQSLLLLVPEKYQAEAYFQSLNEFQPLLFTADLKNSEIKKLWQKVKSGETKVVIGTRSALFLPYVNLGGIIVDYPENENYKQSDQNPRYSSIEVVKWLAELHKVPLAYISPAPPVPLWHMHQAESIKMKNLTGVNTPVEVIDLRHDKSPYPLLSSTLLENLEQIISQNKQAFLYLNRLGDATTVVCEDCGYTTHCTKCDRPLVWQAHNNKLICYHCQVTVNFPLPCPNCRGVNIKFSGTGLASVIKSIQKIWPQVEVTSIQSTDEAKFKNHPNTPIIVGTSAALGKLDFSKIDLVVVVLLDGSLKIPEFRASEEAWQILRWLQTSGTRRLMIQTYSPEHYVVQSLKNNHATQFYQAVLKERINFKYPPAVSLLRLTWQSVNEREAQQGALELKKLALKGLSEAVTIMGPYPDYFKQVRGRYRFHILLRYPHNFPIEVLWPHLPAETIVDRDPYHVLS